MITFKSNGGNKINCRKEGISGQKFVIKTKLRFLKIKHSEMLHQNCIPLTGIMAEYHLALAL